MDFSEYVRTNRPALIRFATVLTGQPWLAGDLVSDVLGRAYERWPTISAMARPHAYVRRMIVNEYLSWRRRFSRVLRGSDGYLPEPAVGDGTDAYAERDAMIALLARLPRRQRAAIVLRYYVGLSDAEAAAELGIGESTVRSTISRALAALRIDVAQPQHHSVAPVEFR